MSNLCKCGCGKETPISPRNRYNLGHVKGEHISYLKGHNYRGIKRPPFSEEWRRNIALSRIGKIPWNKGKKWSEEVKQKLRGPRDDLLGENNPNWKGGIDIVIRGLRRSREYITWKKAIRERDKVCVICGSDKRLQADHIKSFTYFPELRYNLENGRLLCWYCHRKTDNFGARASRMKEGGLGL